MNATTCLILVSISLVARHGDAETDGSIKSEDPRSAVPGYHRETIEGWQIRISDQLRDSQTESTQRAIRLLEGQLKTVAKVLPEGVIARIKTVPIWMSPPYEGFKPTAEYHPNADWLRRAGRHPELARCVELTNIAIFEKECRRMPMMILHELAHAYHHQVLGFEHLGIKAAYDSAVQSGTYEAVRRSNGKTERAYAITNHKEYFAESTESLFGRNDFYPYDRKLLKRHDPKMHALLRDIWHVQRTQGK